MRIKNKTKLFLRILVSCLLVITGSAYPQDPGKPVLAKLPFAFSDAGRTPMENTPVLFKSRLLLVSNYKPGEPFASPCMTEP
jgi:hypothetical protein